MDEYNGDTLDYQNIIFEIVVPSRPWCYPLFETCSVLIIRDLLGSMFYNTCNLIKNRPHELSAKRLDLDFKTLFSDFQEILKGSGLNQFIHELIN